MGSSWAGGPEKPFFLITNFFFWREGWAAPIGPWLAGWNFFGKAGTLVILGSRLPRKARLGPGAALPWPEFMGSGKPFFYGSELEAKARFMGGCWENGPPLFGNKKEKIWGISPGGPTPGVPSVRSRLPGGAPKPNLS